MPVDENKEKQQRIEENGAEEPLLFLKTTKAQATGRTTSDGFVVLKGSSLAAAPTKSCPKPIRQLREKYADRVDEKSVLQEDTLFSSPSAAAGFVTYASANGLIMWGTEDGKTLRDIESV